MVSIFFTRRFCWKIITNSMKYSKRYSNIRYEVVKFKNLIMFCSTRMLMICCLWLKDKVKRVYWSLEEFIDQGSNTQGKVIKHFRSSHPVVFLRQGDTVKPFFQSISWNTVSGIFDETWNTFTLVSKFHCVCFSSIKKLFLQRKDTPDSENVIALILINNICY